MKTYRYKLNLVIESNEDQEDWIKENVDDLIANPEDDFLSLKSYTMDKEMFMYYPNQKTPYRFQNSKP